MGKGVWKEDSNHKIVISIQNYVYEFSAGLC